jgi:hypothetical protein
MHRATFAAAAWAALCVSAGAATHEEVQARIERDLVAGREIVVHVVVALCDNEHQGIVPVRRQLGNGRDPRSNLYWGALYGVRSYFARNGWRALAVEKPSDARVLERVLFFAEVARGSEQAPVYLIAEAWDGAQIEPAIRTFLEMSAGRAGAVIHFERGGSERESSAGGTAHLVALVGHDGLASGARSEAESSEFAIACRRPRRMKPE